MNNGMGTKFVGKQQGTLPSADHQEPVTETLLGEREISLIALITAIIAQ